MFVGKAGRLPYCGLPESCFTRVGSGLTVEYQIRLERPARNKHSRFLRTFENIVIKS
jgi:hypothetical protein